MTETILAPLTTAGVGGVAGRYVEARSESEIIDAVRAADGSGEDLLIVGGGSNLVISDDGYPGTVIHVANTGYAVDERDGSVVLTVQAGQPWDDLVALTVTNGWSGLEALSGIPGLTGATPVQNVGAYGSDVSQTITRVRTWDRHTGSLREFENNDLEFGYRDSILKRSTVNGSPRFVVLEVEFRLTAGRQSLPIRYAELARALGVEIGGTAKAADVRREVLRLRASKGMVHDPADRDTFSTGSFFTNPIVDAATAEKLPANAPRWPADDKIKLSAAWLIDHAGFAKGFGLEGTSNGNLNGHDLAGGRASLSTKHTLAITNRGEASAEDILVIARAVRDGVERTFGIRLQPEPLLIGCSL
ncbi:UDP-N-acetylmuramate dehydrogenase [Arthrobacter sulfonylureivorans]|uniref:UDP-N-acetylmuramate dehydrogenase n=1 Tax=Arthrobacter sulfonylureivorans TaxID=2486855 RepID=UPI0039E6020D